MASTSNGHSVSEGRPVPITPAERQPAGTQLGGKTYRPISECDKAARCVAVFLILASLATAVLGGMVYSGILTVGLLGVGTMGFSTAFYLLLAGIATSFIVSTLLGVSLLIKRASQEGQKPATFVPTDMMGSSRGSQEITDQEFASDGSSDDESFDAAEDSSVSPGELYRQTSPHADDRTAADYRSGDTSPQSGSSQPSTSQSPPVEDSNSPTDSFIEIPK